MGGHDGKFCANCGTTSTPKWRKDRTNNDTILCNACGLKKKRHGREKRPRGRPRQYTPEERKERRQEEQRLYKKTPAGKASHKAAVARYRKTDKGKATQARWTKTRAENLKAATRKKRERAREERMAQGMLPTGYGEHKPPDPSEARHSAHKDGLEEKQLTLLVNLTESPGEVTPLIFASADERFCCPLKHADRIYFGRAVDQTFTHEVGRRDAKFWHVGTRVSIAITVEQSRSYKTDADGAPPSRSRQRRPE